VLDKGSVSSLSWKNSCNSSQGCELKDCIDASVIHQEITYSEMNCFITGCTRDLTECDTQVFVTFQGSDVDGRWTTSDNYRISAFDAYSIRSYLNAARNLGTQTYEMLFSQ
jgi:hypothetical protein